MAYIKYFQITAIQNRIVINCKGFVKAYSLLPHILAESTIPVEIKEHLYYNLVMEFNQISDTPPYMQKLLIEGYRLDEAEQVLDAVRMVDQDAAYEQCRAQLAIRRESAKSPEVTALEEQLEADPDNLDLRAQLAVHYTDTGQFREGLEALFVILQRQLDHNDGATKKAYLDTIASLGKGDPLAAEFQRKLYSLLY